MKWKTENLIMVGKNLFHCGFVLLLAGLNSSSAIAGEKIFMAGAAAVEINPDHYPVHVAGMFEDRTSNVLLDDLHARAIVLDDGSERIAIVVVDNLGLTADLLDRVKADASRSTGIKPSHILISATHTHSAPAVKQMLGTPVDRAYVALLGRKLPQAIIEAVNNLQPAKIGWTVIQDAERTHTRRWVRRPDRIDLDPFGERTVRANMSPGHQNPDVVAQSGPSDADISIFAVQTKDGQPVALVANYANHFYGVGTTAEGKPLISADYYGIFASKLESMVRTGGAPQTGGFDSRYFSYVPPQPQARPFVAMMSQGTSGDQNWHDFSAPYTSAPGIAAYAEAIASEVYDAFKRIEYHDWLPIRMAERRIVMAVQPPKAAWAQELLEHSDPSQANNIPQVYAARQLDMAKLPQRQEVILQAISIGDLAITALPNEVYALTGLKLKRQSPLKTTINIELANDYQGYLPPPEQHDLGGYTTWRHNLRRLETDAEPKIVEATLQLLEKVSGKPRRKLIDNNGAYAEAVLDAKPLAYWRLEEMSGMSAKDATGHGHAAPYEPGVAFWLEGPQSPAFSGEAVINRAVHLAGGRVTSDLDVPADYSAEFWFWNGMPYGARDVTGRLFCDGAAELKLDRAGHIVLTGGDESIVGPAIALKSWHHVALVRKGGRTSLTLNGKEVGAVKSPGHATKPVFGGGPTAADSLEGKIDEIAVYGRALSMLEIEDHYRLAGEVP